MKVLNKHCEILSIQIAVQLVGQSVIELHCKNVQSEIVLTRSKESVHCAMSSKKSSIYTARISEKTDNHL